MKRQFLLGAALIGLASPTVSAEAQGVVHAGAGSYAATPPAYKSKTDSHDGYQAGWMLTREIFCDESPDRPIPTNDWWTDLINNRFSGSLWSYPAMLRTGDYGVEVAYPSYWADEGKEIKSRSSIFVNGKNLSPSAAIASDWHDLDVTFRMPDSSVAGRQMRVTAAHGIPFTWFEFSDASPAISFRYEQGATPSVFGRNDSKGLCGIAIGSDLYALYYPAGLQLTASDGGYSIEGADWAVVALLTEESDLEKFAPYAPNILTDSRVSWNYNETTSAIATEWRLSGRDLRTGHDAPAMMLGLLPHVYKYTISPLQGSIDTRYMTPRGRMEMYAAADGTFRFTYPFSGMMPYYAAPAEDPASESGFSQAVMESLMRKYADEGSFGADTYWGGKGLVQMALNMTFARQTGNEELYLRSRASLRAAFENWLTYTPGEDSFFFSYYPRWGAMLGFNVSYDSDAFNDHHFHYGYFTYAAALLAMEDPSFGEEYGDILRLIAKDYANYDRQDRRFPFLRTLDPWCGHSWAGGMGDAGNDNGNGQESTSEAMQGWGGIYLLGVALGDREMRDAGIWGWSQEARATREYWFDVDAPRPANAGGRLPWEGKGAKEGNYDYSQYKYAYNSNITGKGIGWWTWFGGDPLFMHGIQWMPVSPALDYLSWDNDFVDWAYTDMMNGANSTFSHEWFVPTYNSDNGEEIQPLADNDWGNVTLSYMQRSRPAEAAGIFARALRENRHIATAVSTGHISYYLIHHHLTYGDIDFSVTSDCPTASAYLKDGQYTFMVYNPDDRERTVNFRRDGALLKSIRVAPRRLTAWQTDPVLTDILLSSTEGLVIPPGETSAITALPLDQYGVSFGDASQVSFRVSEPALASIDAAGRLTIAPSTPKGVTLTVEALCGGLSKRMEINVNDRPEVETVQIAGVPEFVETGTPLSVSLEATDQYGHPMETADIRWTLEGSDGVQGVGSTFTPGQPGRYTLRAASGSNPALTAEVTLVVLPMLPEVSLKATAISSSEENVGTKTEFVNDGDSSNRWGSAHSDDQWIMLDLGEDTYLTNASILWEAAYGADYDLQTAPAGCPMTTHRGNYAGVQKDVTVPAEEAWTTVASVRGNGSAGRVETLLDAKGRYFRMKGIRRGSAYGYSIHEMTLRGMPASLSADAPLGIGFTLPDVMDEGESVLLTPVAYTRQGYGTPVAVSWRADKNADFNGNLFTPRDYGVMRVTAEGPGGLTGSMDVFVNEDIRLKELTLTPASTSVIAGDDVHVDLTARNQFGGVYPLSELPLNVRVIDTATGQEADPTVARYNPETEIFSAGAQGEYQIEVSGGIPAVTARAVVKAIALTEANIALGRPASASSYEGWNKASLINDGDARTRWESSWADDQWVKIDLQSPYILSHTVLLWEGAYSTVYSIEASLDGETWQEIHSTSSGKGGREEIAVSGDVPARWLRLNCKRRALNYGNSLYEWEVYAKRRLIQTGVEEIPAAEIGSDTPCSRRVYNLQGIELRLPAGTTPADLPSGLYIIDGRKIRVR